MNKFLFAGSLLLAQYKISKLEKTLAIKNIMDQDYNLLSNNEEYIYEQLQIFQQQLIEASHIINELQENVKQKNIEQPLILEAYISGLKKHKDLASTLQNFTLPILKLYQDNQTIQALELSTNYIEEGSFYNFKDDNYFSCLISPYAHLAFLIKDVHFGLTSNEEASFIQLKAYSNRLGEKHVVNVFLDMIDGALHHKNIDSLVSQFITLNLDFIKENKGYLIETNENFSSIFYQSFTDEILDIIEMKIAHQIDLFIPHYLDKYTEHVTYNQLCADIENSLVLEDITILKKRIELLDLHVNNDTSSIEEHPFFFNKEEKRNITNIFKEYILPISEALHTQNIGSAYQALIQHLDSNISFTSSALDINSIEEICYTYAQFIFTLKEQESPLNKKEMHYFNIIQQWADKNEILYNPLLEAYQEWLIDPHSSEYQDSKNEFFMNYELPGRDEDLLKDYNIDYIFHVNLPIEFIQDFNTQIDKLKTTFESSPKSKITMK